MLFLTNHLSSSAYLPIETVFCISVFSVEFPPFFVLRFAGSLLILSSGRVPVISPLE